MREIIFLLVYITLIMYSSAFSQGWRLAWEDDFDGSRLNEGNWNVESWSPGIWNNELQRYTAGHDQPGSNIRVENGNLIIEARKNGSDITSGRINTKNKKDYTYARFEVRAKVPAGRGTWPAIWLYPSDESYGQWPRSGEIDFMEFVGCTPDSIHGALHTARYNALQGTQRKERLYVPDAARNFHVYTVEWHPDSVLMFMDNTRYLTYRNLSLGWEYWPFDKRFHLILNLAIGGTWGGRMGVDNALFPAQFVIDWVRVYTWKPSVSTIPAEEKKYTGNKNNLKIHSAIMHNLMLTILLSGNPVPDVSGEIYSIAGRKIESFLLSGSTIHNGTCSIKLKKTLHGGVFIMILQCGDFKIKTHINEIQ